MVTMVRKAEKIQRQAVEETNKELSYTQLVRIGKLIADASCVDFYVYDMNIYLAKYGCALFFMPGNCRVFTRKLIYKGCMRPCPQTDMWQLLSVIRAKTSSWRRLKKCCTGRNENYRNLRKQERRGRSICNRVLYAAGSEKVEEFWSSTFFASGKYLLDILYGMEFSRRYEENIALNSRYEKSGKNLLWRFSEKESD